MTARDLFLGAARATVARALESRETVIRTKSQARLTTGANESNVHAITPERKETRTMTATLTFKDYVYGDETARLRFERENGAAGMYEHERVYRPWDPETARSERAIARALMQGDEWHRSGRCKHGTVAERMSCGTCALHGYEPRGGWGDSYRVRHDGPNYAGWKRVYVQSGTPIPEQWRAAFSTFTDNAAYENALGRDLVTFGHPGWAA